MLSSVRAANSNTRSSARQRSSDQLGSSQVVPTDLGPWSSGPPEKSMRNSVTAAVAALIAVMLVACGGSSRSRLPAEYFSRQVPRGKPCPELPVWRLRVQREGHERQPARPIDRPGGRCNAGPRLRVGADELLSDRYHQQADPGAGARYRKSGGAWTLCSCTAGQMPAGSIRLGLRVHPLTKPLLLLDLCDGGIFAVLLRRSGAGIHGGDGMIFSGARRFCGLVVRVRVVRLGLVVGAVALACGGGAGARPAPSAPAAAHLYWTIILGGKVRKASLDGTGVATIATGQTYPTGVAVDGTNLYWTNLGASNTIVESNLDGTNAMTIATGNTPYGVAVGGGHLYWADYGNGGNPKDKIVEANLDGTNAKTIAITPFPVAVAVGGGHLYWADTGTKIVEASLNGANARTIAKGKKFFPVGVAVAGGHLYWATSAYGHGAGNDTIVEANLNGTGAKTIATEGYGQLRGLAAGGGHLYWTFADTIVEANLDGTGATTIVTKQNRPGGVAVGP